MAKVSHEYISVYRKETTCSKLASLRALKENIRRFHRKKGIYQEKEIFRRKVEQSFVNRELHLEEKQEPV